MKRWLTLRKVGLFRGAVAALGSAAFWIVTIPVTVSASALPQYTPNIDNGQTMFNIGGCASCHAIPDKEPDKVDRTRLGGGPSPKMPFGTFYAPHHSPDSTDGLRRLGAGGFLSTPLGRHGAGGAALP